MKLAVVILITAAMTVFIAGVVFYFIYRVILSRWRIESSFRREVALELKGVIVAGDSLTKLHYQHLSHSFSYARRPNSDEEEVKQMTTTSTGIQTASPCGNGNGDDVKTMYPVLNKPELPVEPPPEKQITHSPAPPPPPPPPPPLKAKEGKVVSLPKPPPAAKMIQKVGTETEDSAKHSSSGMKLKPLHWEKVNADGDSSLVWNEINDGSFRFDDDLMEALFRRTPEKTMKNSTQGSSSCRPQAHKTFILDSRKSQNSAIVLKSLGLSKEEIIEALVKGRSLNSEILEKLTNISPSQVEIKKIINFDGNPVNLADAESFIYCVLKAVPSAFACFKAMLFRSRFSQEIQHLKESLQTLEAACRELKNRGVFHKFLEAILKAGNRMNAGTSRGNARGFDLTALRKLSDIKSSNGDTTLLHFVVEQVVHSEGKRRTDNRNEETICNTSSSRLPKARDHEFVGLSVVESLSNDFVNVKKASAIDYSSLIAFLPNLGCRVEELKQSISRCNDNNLKGFLAEMKDFLEDCMHELELVKEEEKKVLELVKKTTEYYKADQKDGNPMHLFVIVKDFVNNVDRVCNQISSKLHKGESAITNSSQSLSPSRPKSPPITQSLQSYIIAQTPKSASSDSEDSFGS